MRTVLRTVLAISPIAFALLGMPTNSFAAENGVPETQTSVVPDGQPTPPEAQTDGTEPAGDQADTDDSDIMQNFTRHRPGACPEGPPCKVED